jgi:hypothetical protein
MFVTIRPNTIEPVVADCHCASSQNIRFINKTNDVKKSGMPTEKYRDNVISITAAIKSAERMSARKVSKVEFIYPMLECI